MASSLAHELGSVVGPSHVLTDADVRAGFEVDWTGRWRGNALAVVRPGTVEEVAAVTAWCRRHDVAVVAQGGNTGLVGGGVPGPERPAGTVVLSLRRLAHLDPVDLLAGQVTVGAGASLAAVHRHVAGTGWAVGVDLGARDEATIGGMAATNAGGVRVLRHGTMRAQVLGVEAVLADGSVVRHLQGLVKDNTGYDLTGLLVGSEGTLGVITALRLRLVPEPDDRLVVLVGVPSLTEAVELAGRLRAVVDGLDALEVVDGPGLALVVDELGLPPPFDRPVGAAVLVEWAGRGSAPAALAEVIGGRPAVAASDGGGRARLWRYREGMTEAISHWGVPHKLDVTLPIARLAEFADEVRSLAARRWPGARLDLFGHLGDGNLHVNLTGVDPADERVDEAVLELVAAYDGSISAEHGVGRAKARWLHLSRSPAELAAMRAIKAALDPTGILNPGVVLA